MGQIIDLEQWRRDISKRRSTGEESRVGQVQVASASWVEEVMLPSATLWRSVVATWACLWLAPWGLEVRPIAARRSFEPPRRRSSTH
jgi:hypothetical protein